MNVQVWSVLHTLMHHNQLFFTLIFSHEVIVLYVCICSWKNIFSHNTFSWALKGFVPRRQSRAHTDQRGAMFSEGMQFLEKAEAHAR